MIQKIVLASSVVVVLLILMGCKSTSIPVNESEQTKASKSIPITQDSELQFFRDLQGQWIGKTEVLGMKFDWFTWDYRAISSSHLFSIFEGGDMGNLLTSFFITEIDGTQTIVARNGGLLSSIYRTSYFVLDKMELGDDEHYYRFVDAIGGKDMMFMELTFKDNSLTWTSHTSRLGDVETPRLHYSFQGEKYNEEMSNGAAKRYGFPTLENAWDLKFPFDTTYLYQNRSATFMWEDDKNPDVFDMARKSKDPFRIDQHPELSTVDVDIKRNAEIEGKRLYLFLSTKPLTDEQGYLLNEEEFNSVVLFPELSEVTTQFQLTYIHPGDYYLTVIADANDDRGITDGDITHPSIKITVEPKSKSTVKVRNITVKN